MDWRFLTVDWEDLENAETARDVHVQRIKEVYPSKVADKFRFPLADGSCTQPWSSPKPRGQRNLRWILEDA